MRVCMCFCNRCFSAVSGMMHKGIAASLHICVPARVTENPGSSHAPRAGALLCNGKHLGNANNTDQHNRGQPTRSANIHSWTTPILQASLQGSMLPKGL